MGIDLTEAVSVSPQMNASWILKCVLVLWTAFFGVVAMPPFNIAESAYVFLVPLALWLSKSPSWKSVFIISFCSGFLSWAAIFIWLRHVTYIGTFFLSVYVTFYFVVWVAYARILLPKLKQRSFLIRIFGACSLAGAWVFLEWMRASLIYGTPMGPLALSQWQRPVMLQISAWTGSYGVSFALVFINICMSLAWLRLLQFRRLKGAFSWFNADFYAGLSLIGLLFFAFLQSLPKEHKNESESFTVAVVQPNFAALKEWTAEENTERIKVLEKQIQRVALQNFDLLLLPEAVTANPILGDYETLTFFESQVALLGKPILTGNTAHIISTDLWYNGVFLIRPNLGLDANFYAKRRLVPFGEYVPFPFYGFFKALGASQGSFAPGDSIALKSLSLKGRLYNFASLVCYEDMFPNLARASVLGGADILFVATNDVWFGEEGAAEFHAAHSVLRAVENRRPVIRSGNAGWSGWIDPMGNVRACLTNDDQSIFFRGSGTFPIELSGVWTEQTSFYTQWGDWFVGLSFLISLTGLGYFCLSVRGNYTSAFDSEVRSSINS